MSLGSHRDKCPIAIPTEHNIATNLITSSHRWTVALSGYEAMYVLSSVIGLFVKESTSLCSNKPVSLAGLEQRAESILVYLTSEQINCNAD